MIKSLFTKEQLQDLRREFVKFKLADMTSEDLFAYIRDIMMNELIDLEKEMAEFNVEEIAESIGASAIITKVLATFVFCIDSTKVILVREKVTM